jgi:hypothetical protein
MHKRECTCIYKNRMFKGKCGVNIIEMHYIGVCVSDGENVEGGDFQLMKCIFCY